MEAVHAAVLVAHMIGILAILVGAIASLIKVKGWSLATLVWGARLQVLTGIALAVMLIAGVEEDAKVNPAKLAVKLIVALAVAALAESAARRSRKAPLLGGVILLTLANAAIASMW